MRYFEIKQSYTNYSARLPISFKVREYFEQFFIENILKKKRIIIDGSWKINVVVSFMGAGGKGPRTIFSENRPSTIKVEGVKQYIVFAPIDEVESAQDKYLRSIELLFQAIREFFIVNYKKVKKEEIDQLWQKVDLEYLLSLPYPAPEEDQKYVGDELSKYP